MIFNKPIILTDHFVKRYQERYYKGRGKINKKDLIDKILKVDLTPSKRVDIIKDKDIYLFTGTGCEFVVKEKKQCYIFITFYKHRWWQMSARKDKLIGRVSKNRV